MLELTTFLTAQAGAKRRFLDAIGSGSIVAAPSRAVERRPPLRLAEATQYQRFKSEQRGTISAVTALILPIMIGVMALGFDISYRASVRSELQRTADISALAGAGLYASTVNSSSALTATANVIELNGFPVGTRGGNGTTTLTDNYGNYSASISFVSPGTIVVTAQRVVSLMFSNMFLSTSSQTVSATAAAQISPRASGNLSCALALNGSSNSITTTDNLTISGGNNTNIQMSGCNLRSDASIQFNGTSTVGTPSIVASGTIDGSYNPSCQAGQTPCDQRSTSMPQVPDPFASKYGGVLNVSGSATPPVSSPCPNGLSGYICYGPAPAGTVYDSFTVNSNTYFSPGVYYIAGSISFGGNSTVLGTGVTFIMTDGLSSGGGSTLNLSAPTSGPTAGLLFGSNLPPGPNDSNIVQFDGNSTQNLTGAIYMPNSSVTITGSTNWPNDSTDGTSLSNCLISVAQSVTFAGSSSFAASGCASFGVPTTYDLPSIARLTQ